ncbi:Na(+)/H(+) antiporter subunit D [compost metagenome]
MIISVGLIAFGLAAANEASIDGVVFYLLHDMIAKALLFILGGTIIHLAGTSQLKDMGGLIKRYPAAGWMFFITSLAIAGIPPLSGFAGKLLIIQGGLQKEHYALTAVSLASSLIVLYSLIRLFMNAFWGEEKVRPASVKTSNRGMLVPAVGLFILVLAMGLGSEWVYRFAAEAGETLMNPAIYVDAVLKE